MHHTMNFGQLFDRLSVDHLSCLKCERRAVRALRGKSAGDAAPLSAIDPSVHLSGPHAALSFMFTTSRLSGSASSRPGPSKPSIKTPARPRPLSPPLAAHKPLAAPRDQTARLWPWLRVSIGSYGNGRLSPYSLIG